MAPLICPACREAITEPSAFCPHCGTPRPTVQIVPQASALGSCYRCRQAASARCPDCGRFFCTAHGGMDWARYPACNHCRGRRRVLLALLLPLLLALFFAALALLYFLKG
jgi:hypothetical protein